MNYKNHIATVSDHWRKPFAKMLSLQLGVYGGILSFIILVVSSCLLSCNNRQEQKKSKGNLTVEDYVQIGINNYDNSIIIDSISDKLNNLIIEDTSFYKLYISQSYSIEKDELSLFFERKYYSQADIFQIHFHGFEICLNDSIMVDGIKDELASVKGGYLNYYNLHIDGTYKTEMKKDSIEYFGEVQIPNLYAHVGVNTKPNNRLDKSKWKSFFYSINEIIYCYDKIRDNIAKKKFEKSFNELNQKEKKSVTEYRPLKVMVSFDMEFCSETITPPAAESVPLVANKT
ncbi:MAG: hypothetical protein K0B10_12335 [Vicingaceae bacterium]|nr:hypothetical protein [Vicingaceae bacterium]